MTNLSKFNEFITNNPPPCIPGDQLYWFDADTGRIFGKRSDRVIGLVLTEKLEWKIIGEDNELIIPNEDPYFCLTRENAKKFRDEISNVKYAIFTPSPIGNLLIDDTPFSYVKTESLSPKNVEINDDYITYIIKTDYEVKPGDVIKFDTQGESAYYILDNNTYEECFIKATDKKSKRILEDLFDY